MISVLYPAFGQLSIGPPAFQENVEVTIHEDGSVNVVHEIRKDNQTRSLELIPGKVSNLKVVDSENNEKKFGISETEELTTLTLFPSNKNLFVKYDLKPQLEFVDGMWRWKFLYLHSTKFHLPQNAELIFANGTPVLRQNNESIKCHGCQMNLEYALDEPEIIKTVNFGDQKFEVKIRTLSQISEFIFDQPSKRISFEVEDDKFVTVVIPRELLWEPYDVFLDERKIQNREFYNDGENIWLNFKTNMTGTVDIIGTSAIPEFPAFIPLVIGITMIIAIQFRNKIILR